MSMPPQPPPGSPPAFGTQPPPFGAPPSLGAAPIKPSGLWHVLGGVLMGVGVIGGFALMGILAWRQFSKVEDFSRVDVPGEGVVTIDKAGGYTVYHEYPGADDRFSVDLDVSMTAPDGSDVELDDYSTNVSYEWEGHDGVAIYSFRAEEAGDYRVTTDGSFGEVAVGRGIGSGLFSGIFGGFIFGFVCFVAGLVIVIVTAVKRGKSKRQQLYSNYGTGPTWGAPPPSAAYPPPGSYPPPPGGYPPVPDQPGNGQPSSGSPPPPGRPPPPGSHPPST